MPNEQSLQGGSPCHPLDPGRGEVVENLAPPPAQPCLDSALFQKPPILGIRTWLPSGPPTLSVLLWGLHRQNKSPCSSCRAPACSSQVTATPEVTCRHLRSPKGTLLRRLDPPGPAAVLPSSSLANYAPVMETHSVLKGNHKNHPQVIRLELNKVSVLTFTY